MFFTIYCSSIFETFIKLLHIPTWSNFIWNIDSTWRYMCSLQVSPPLETSSSHKRWLPPIQQFILSYSFYQSASLVFLTHLHVPMMLTLVQQITYISILTHSLVRTIHSLILLSTHLFTLPILTTQPHTTTHTTQPHTTTHTTQPHSTTHTTQP